MSNIFISYSSATREQAKALAEQLSALKYSVWWDSSLIPTGSYSEEIKQQLDAASAIIVVWSTEAATSLWVKSEASHAAGQGKLINTHVPGFDVVRKMPRPFEQIHSVPVTDTTAIVTALREKKVPRGARQHEPATAAALKHEELLPFLNVCTNDELDPLVRYTDKAWNVDKIYERSLKSHPLYPEHVEYVAEIERQFRLLGGHGIANIFRGESYLKAEGPRYRDILLDLAKRNKIETGAADTVPEMEKKLVIKKFDDVYAKMTPEQKAEFAATVNKELERRGAKFRLDSSMTRPAAAVLLMAGAEISGFFIFQASAILANAFAQALIGQGLTFAANAGLMRVLGIATGPVGWTLTGLYTAYELTKPAYMSLESGVLHIAAIREMKLYGSDGMPAPQVT